MQRRARLGQNPGHGARPVRLHDRRGRLRWKRPGQPPLRRPGEPRAGAGGGPARLPLGRLHPHAGGASVPDREPLLRLEVRVGARAAHERAADLPRAREGPGRLQQHQRHDLPARQPPGLRALGRRRRAWTTWDYAHCLPYFKRMERCMAAGLEDEFRGHAGPLVLERGPARSPLFGAFFEAVQQAGYPLTEDVNGFRQEGFAPFDRNIRNGRRLSAARAYLHPVMSRPNLDVETRAFVTKVLFEGDRAVGVEYTHHRGAREARDGRRGHPVRRRDQLAAVAAAVGRRQRGRAPARSGSTSCTTCPASASTCRTTWRSTSSTHASSPSRWRRT